MERDDVVITRGLPGHLREAGAGLFDEAFGDKLRMAIPDRDKRVAYIVRVLDGRHALAATRGAELVGMIGLSSCVGPYRGGLLDIPWDPRPFSDLLGFVGALRASLGLRFAEHRPAADELYVDGVAVSPAVRGQGIGSRLLVETEAIARERGLRWLRLDVIDTNPRAQALYERLGYRVTRVEKTNWMERWTGFGAIISMERAVGQDTSAQPGTPGLAREG
jgi:ribosomal protein S18 acetylase RimI-like enzyme